MVYKGMICKFCFGRLVIVSYNEGKVCEICVLFVLFGMELVLVKVFDLFEFEEIGIIFVVNVMIKV